VKLLPVETLGEALEVLFPRVSLEAGAPLRAS
jgi:hypothetical protein